VIGVQGVNVWNALTTLGTKHQLANGFALGAPQ